jgi:adenosylhomocysteine nucleosidase
MIGLIGAMDEEISLFRDNMTDPETITHARMKYITGKLCDQRIVLLKSGIGKVNAAIGTQIMIDRFDIDQIVFSGLAGSLVPNLSAGDVVVANHVVQYDFDLTAFGRRVGELPDFGRMIETDPRLLKLACYAFDNSLKKGGNSPRMMVGTIVSGDRFVSDPRRIEWLQREFGAVATEMEGAAVGFTCFVNDIPFVIIRTISDSGGTEAKDEFEKYLKIASENSYRMVTDMLAVSSYKTDLEAIPIN